MQHLFLSVAGDKDAPYNLLPHSAALAASVKMEAAAAEQPDAVQEDNAAASAHANLQRIKAHHWQQQAAPPPAHTIHHPVGLAPLRMQTRGALKAAAAALELQQHPEHGQGSHSAPA